MKIILNFGIIHMKGILQKDTFHSNLVKNLNFQVLIVSNYNLLNGFNVKPASLNKLMTPIFPPKCPAPTA